MSREIEGSVQGARADLGFGFHLGSFTNTIKLRESLE